MNDECGVCGGDGSDDLGCGCFEAGPSGCDNACGSELVDDECGVCGGNGTSCLDEIISFGVSTDTTLEILYESSEAIAGFQFTIDGATISGSSGGAAADAGFTVSTSELGIVIGFSFSGSTIPAGSGVLTNLTYSATSTELCLTDLVVSDQLGSGLAFEEGSCLSSECADIDNDTVCDDVDDCVGDYDECGVCNGGGIADGDCDCAGNVDLGCGCGEAGPSGCDSVCGSDLAELDECGECGGDGIADGAL